MSKTMCVSLFLCGMFFCGCSLLQEHKDEIHAKIIEYVKTDGQEAAVKYIDKLVEEGRLGSKNAEELKAAIPQGIEKLENVMNKQEETNE